MEALQEKLAVKVERARFLVFQRAVHGVDAPEDAATSRGVASEGVCAGPGRCGTVGAVGAKPHTKNMPQSEQDQNLKALGASQRVSCQELPPGFKVRQLLGERLGFAGAIFMFAYVRVSGACKSMLQIHLVSYLPICLNGI